MYTLRPRGQAVISNDDDTHKCNTALKFNAARIYWTGGHVSIQEMGSIVGVDGLLSNVAVPHVATTNSAEERSQYLLQ